jgi:hypothetical protein
MPGMLQNKSANPASGLDPNAEGVAHKAQGWRRFLRQPWVGNGCAINPAVAAGRNSFRVVWNRVAFPDI